MCAKCIFEEKRNLLKSINEDARSPVPSVRERATFIRLCVCKYTALPVSSCVVRVAKVPTAEGAIAGNGDALIASDGVRTPQYTTLWYIGEAYCTVKRGRRRMRI